MRKKLPKRYGKRVRAAKVKRLFMRDDKAFLEAADVYEEIERRRRVAEHFKLSPSYDAALLDLLGWLDSCEVPF